MIIIKVFPNKTKVWEYEKLIGGSGKKGYHDPYYLLKDKNENYFWCGETYQNGWEGGFYLEKISPKGEYLCEYKWEDPNSAADEFVFLAEYDNKIFVTGRENSQKGIIYIFDKNCNLIETLEHDIECGYNEGIFSLIKANETFFIFLQLCYENNRYTVRVYGLIYKTKKYFLVTILKNLTIGGVFGKEYYLLNSSNFFVAGGTHYPSYNISLFGFNQNLSLVYHRVYPFKGTLRHGDLGWRKGTVIYAGDRGFTAYLFNATNGELLAFYNSSLSRKAYALDVKRDFIPGCYVIIGSEQVSGNDWQIRIERICEKNFMKKGNQKPVANFTYKINGLQVTFNSTSFDPDGKISKYFWDFGDGEYSFEENPVHIYKTNGKYRVRLLVEDDNGAKQTITKNIEIRSDIDRIEITDIQPVNSLFRLKINFVKPLNGKIVFINQTFDFKNMKSVEISFSTPSREGFYNLVISVNNTNYTFPVLVLSESKYLAYLKLLTEKYFLERKFFEISQNLSIATISLGKEYLSGYISENLEKLKNLIKINTEQEINKFAEKVAKYSKTLSSEIKEKSPEIAENTVNFVIDKINEYGSEAINYALTQSIYHYLLLPEIEEYQINKTYLIEEEYQNIVSKTEKASKYISELENIPVYNLTLFGINFAPSLNYFLEKFNESIESGPVLAPWEIKEFIEGDTKSLLTIPVILGYFNSTEIEIKLLPVIPVLITAAKLYMEISESVKKISPPLILFGAYTSSYILSNKISPQILKQTGFKKSSLETCNLDIFVNKTAKVNISVNASCNGINNLYFYIALNSSAKIIDLQPVDKHFEKSYSFVPNESGTYLVKACIFSGDENLICRIKSFTINKSTPLAAVVSEVNRVRVINMNNETLLARITCDNRKLEFFMKGNEERYLENCYGNVLVYVNGTLTDGEVVKKGERHKVLCNISKIFLSNGENLTVTCTRKTKIKFISPSGKVFEDISERKIFTPEENGTWEIEIDGKNFFFIVEEMSVLKGRIKNNESIVVENEFGRRIKNVKISCNNIIQFTDENGIARINTSICDNFFISKPFYKEYILKKEKATSIPVEILKCNDTKYKIREINVSALSPKRYVIPIRAYEIISNGFCTIKFYNVSSLWAIDGISWRKIGEKGKDIFTIFGNRTIVFAELPEIFSKLICNGIWFSVKTNFSGNFAVCYGDSCKSSNISDFLLDKENFVIIDAKDDVEEENENDNILSIEKCKKNVNVKIENGRKTVEYVSPFEKEFLVEESNEIHYEKITSAFRIVFNITPFSFEEFFSSPACKFKRKIENSLRESIIGKCNRTLISENEKILRIL